MNSQSSQIAIVAILFLILTITTVSLRCYVRARLTGGFGADDAFSVASLVCWTPPTKNFHICSSKYRLMLI